MANTHPTLVSLFDDIADAIREKIDDPSEIVADTFPSVIRSIPKVRVQSSKTVTSSMSKQTVKPDSGYDALAQVVVNAMTSGILKHGTFTPTNYTTFSQTITHGLGVVPNFGLCMRYPWNQTAKDQYGNDRTTEINRYNPLFGFYEDTLFYISNLANSNINVGLGNVTLPWEEMKDEAVANSTLGRETADIVTPLKWSGATSTKITLGADYDQWCYEFYKGIVYHWFVGKI